MQASYKYNMAMIPTNAYSYSCNHAIHILADEANASQCNVEYKQRVYGYPHAVPHHARPAHYANASGQRPGHKYQVDRNARYRVEEGQVREEMGR